MESAAPQLNGIRQDQPIAAVLNAAYQDLSGGYENDDAVVAADDLPIGIFPEAHPESCNHALRRHGLACTRLNAELFYEMDQLGRNRLMGCSTEELGEIDLWDQCSGSSIWHEPMVRMDGRLITPEEQLDNLNRQARWQHVELFLKEVYGWCQTGQAPEIVVHRNRQGRSTWRFRRLRWTEGGITQDDSAPEMVAGPKEILHAGWNFIFWCRRRWLNAHPGKVWLSEYCLHLIRHAFRALLNHFEVPQGDWPEIKEDQKPAWPSKHEAKLSELEDRERRAVRRIRYLHRAGLLTGVKLRQALGFFDDLAEEIAVTQRRLDDEMVRLARQNGYDDEYHGARLELAYLSPDELLGLKEEMEQLLSIEPKPMNDPSSKINPQNMIMPFLDPTQPSTPHNLHMGD